jgi:hypothetical protein
VAAAIETAVKLLPAAAIGSIARMDRKGEHKGYGETRERPPVGMLPMVGNEESRGYTERERSEVEKRRNEADAENRRRREIRKEEELERLRALDEKFSKKSTRME